MLSVVGFSLLALILGFIFYGLTALKRKEDSNTNAAPPSFPIVGSLFIFLKNRRRLPQWVTEVLLNAPSHTITLHRLGGPKAVITANPANVEHILKTRFENYPKGDFFSAILHDLLGRGIINADGENWKLQRKVASYEFSTNSLRDFISESVHGEITHRLLPLLRKAAAGNTLLDMQDVLKRFAFDNICKVAFGTDPTCLDLSLPASEFAEAFDEATELIVKRFSEILPLMWRLKRFFKLGSERRLHNAIRVIHNFAEEVIRKKNQQISLSQDEDLLSRFLSLPHGATGVQHQQSNNDFVRDIVISFMLAGRDTTSAALTWFFWLVSSHPRVEARILQEIRGIVAARGEGGEVEGFCYEEVKEMNYLHAAICESMRLYPPVPSDTKEALHGDVLPDGTVVRAGTRVTYHPYAMGRMESIWGADCLEFRPERWVKEEHSMTVRAESPFKYPVFQAGPRICLGKEMAFIQMKCIAASVMREFSLKVEPTLKPHFLAGLTAKMQGGLPVSVEKRTTPS